MKKIILVSLMIACIVSMFAAQKTITLSNGKTGVSIASEKASGLVLDYNLRDLNLSDISTKGGAFTELTVEGFIGTSQAGLPKLPYYGNIITVPVNAVLSVNFVNTHSTEIELNSNGFNNPVNPAQPSLSKSEDADKQAFVYNRNAYQNANYDSYSPVSIKEIGYMRGYRLVEVSYTPVQYNPLKNSIKVFDNVKVEIAYEGADYAATEYLRAKTYSSAFEPNMVKSVLNYSAPATRDNLTRYPMKYVIIADPMFTAQLAPFIEWKTQQGFQVIVKYKGEAEVGSTKESIKAYLQSLWNAATPESPAPTYLLIVGDHGQIPAWSAQASPSGHITDLTYVRLEGNDFLPEIFYGRFSANNVAELQPQIDKTLYYEKYQMSDPTYLGKQILIAGVDSSHGTNWANGQINYISSLYANEANGVTPYIHLYPGSGTAESAILSETNQGVGWINYTAHGDWNMWYDPNMTVANVNALTNSGKYPFVIGNCCLTNKFENLNCFGESWLRAADKGAIGYVGGTNSTYWDEDYWFACGVRAIPAGGTAQPYDANHLGMYDQAYHTHNEAYSNWNVSAMGMINAGNMSVQSGSSTAAMKQYYWEIYSLMGDPSLVPYLKQATTNPAQYITTLFIGLGTMNISGAAPYSYVALSFNGELRGSALCDANGDALLVIDPITTPGTAKLVISAQNYIPVVADVMVVPNEGPYIVYNSMTLSGPNTASIDYNTQAQMSVTVNNVGSEAAQNLTAKLRSLSPYVSVADSTEEIASVSANGNFTMNNAFSITAAPNSPDAENASLELVVTDTQNHTWTSTVRVLLNAPVISTGAMTINDTEGNNNGRLDPGESIILTVPILNNGHATSQSGNAHFVSTNSGVVIENTNFNISPIAAAGILNFDLAITANAEIPAGTITNIGVFTQVGSATSQTNFILPVGLELESFETGNLTAYPWVTSPTGAWTVVNTGAFDGAYCAKSGTIGNNATTFISVVDTVSVAGNIKFAYKVSSEADYDKLKFYIDSTEKEVWSGDVDWAQAEYAVTPGVHTFKWAYSKDGSQNSGSDCAWIDKIIFPAAGQANADAPIAFVNADTLTFGSVLANNTLAKELSIVNFGNQALTGSVTAPQGFYVNTPGNTTYSYNIPAQSNIVLNIVFAPTQTGTYNGQLTISTNDTQNPQFVVAITAISSTPSSDIENLPKVTTLKGNYPNPFNPVTNICFSLKETTPVTLDIYNVKGQLVKQVIKNVMPAGNHNVIWNGKDQNNKTVASGVYFYRMQTNKYTSTRKMLLMK